MAKRKKLKLPPFVCIKKNSWHVRKMVPTSERDDKGRIKYISVTRKCSPETVERAAAIVAFIEREVKSASAPKAADTLADLFQIFFEAKRPHISRVTIEHYESLFERMVRPNKVASMRISEIDPIHLQMYFSQLGCPPATKKKVYALINMVFRQAVLWKMVRESPVVGIMLPRARSKRTKPLSEKEAQAVIAVCRTDIKYLIIELGLETGLRPEELIPLTWADIDLDECTVNINKAIADRLKGGGYEIIRPKTATSHRTVALSQELKQRLELHRGNLDVLRVQLKVESTKPLTRRMQWTLGVNHKKRVQHRQLVIGHLKKLNELDLVFPSSTGGYRSIKNVNKRLVKELFKEAGLDATKYSFKCLRHTFATILARHINPAELQQLLGHSDPRVTFRFYVGADEEAKHTANTHLSKILYSPDE